MRKSMSRNRPRQPRAFTICGRFQRAGETYFANLAPRMRLNPSFVVIKKPEAMFLHKLIPLREFKILAHHLAHEIPERGLRYPPQLSLRFRCIAEQRFDLGRPEYPGSIATMHWPVPAL